MGDRLFRRAAQAVAVPAVAAQAVAVLAGCGVRPTGIITAGGGVKANGRTGTIIVYLVRSGRVVVPVVRPGLPGHPYLAVSQLAVPPTSDERYRGLYTEVRYPVTARLTQALWRPEKMGMLTVDLSSGIPHRRVHWSRTALAQISCTAQAVPGVTGVLLRGGPGADKAGWGSARCEDYRDLMG
jgi:hypothetical protein